MEFIIMGMNWWSLYRRWFLDMVAHTGLTVHGNYSNIS